MIFMSVSPLPLEADGSSFLLASSGVAWLNLELTLAGSGPTWVRERSDSVADALVFVFV